MKFSDIEHIFVINLDRRPDRLDLIDKQLKRFNLNYERISAIDGNLLNPNPKIGNGWNHKGVAGCALTHRKIIEIAKERNYKNFLVIEDDTVFSDEFKNIDSYIKQVPNDWDVIYFTSLHLSKPKNVNVNVFKSTHTLVTNMLAMNSKFYDVVLDNLPNKVEKLEKPIDILFTDLQKNYNFYSLRPHVAWQDSIFSDIENKSQELPHLNPIIPKISLIISSYNQKERLRFCLKSAITQSYYNYEVIVADDSSTDGTIEMIRNEFSGVKVFINENKQKDIYCLAENWNFAAKHATGERLIFTNADCMLPTSYVQEHAEPKFFNSIIFGPNERLDENVASLLSKDISPKQLIDEYLKISTIGKDLRHDNSAYTYGQEYNYFYPWGNNMSVPKKSFLKVGGFPKLREYGGEEILLSKKLTIKEQLKVYSNYKTINYHLWHPVVNKLKKPFNEHEYNDYIIDNIEL